MSELLLDRPAKLAELDAIEAESIGWQPLGEGAYLHIGKPQEEEVVITVTGVADAREKNGKNGDRFIFCRPLAAV